MSENGESGADVLKRCGDDASKWAAEFRAMAVKLGYSDMDEGWLIGWFANAIMHSQDVRRWRQEAANREKPVKLSDSGMDEERTARVYADVQAERTRQDAKWGPTHDDEHSVMDFGRFVLERAAWITGTPRHQGEPLPQDRTLLIEIAALAVAALESWDRKARMPRKVT